MKSLKITGLCLLAVLLLSACATGPKVSRDDPRYQQGYEMGLKAAEEDRATLDCGDPWLGRQSMERLRSYAPQWKKAGRSATFVAGFKYGYNEAYRENIVTMCD